MRTFHLVATIAFAIALSGCHKPTETVIPSDTAKWDAELAPQLQKLSDDDRAKVSAFLMRGKMGEVLGGKGIPPGTTIGDAIKEQAKFEKERAEAAAREEALKKKLEQERATVRAELEKAVTVTLVAKRELPRNFEIRRISDYQEFKIGVENRSAKAIAGVSGTINFIDVFDKEVGSVNFRITETIEPGKTAVWTGGRDYNQFIDTHRAVWNLEEGKYKTRFVPEAVVYADGTKLAIAE
jgi:hypothetical protein